MFDARDEMLDELIWIKQCFYRVILILQIESIHWLTEGIQFLLLAIFSFAILAFQITKNVEME